MEYYFPSKEKDNNDSALPRGRTEGMTTWSTDNGTRGLYTEDSFSNVAELMNFDTYAGWCNSPTNLADQMFAYSSPLTTPSTNYSSFDGFNFTHQYNSGMSIVDDDIMGSPFISEDKVMFRQIDSQMTSATNCADDGYLLVEAKDESSSKHDLIESVVNNVIPRPPMHTLAEKMLKALNLFKEWSGGGILAQLWVPMKNGDQYILSTCEQPYLLDQTLSGYREVSRLFTFATESKPGSFLGLPGRVFASKIPEWTSNVMYYNKAEYLRVQYAVDHEIRGSIALPIFDDDSRERSCCAVLELVTMKEKPNFDLEMENVCRALQVVNLTSTVPQRHCPKSLSKNQKAALAEITDVLRAVCYAHRLPLALTWIPCSYVKDNGGCNRSENKKCVLCIEDSACYVNDKDIKGFVHACAEHYLEEGQGIVGKALQSNHPFFYPDVKEYHISEYPLVHHARKFGLNAAVAIKLRSVYTGDDDYILELFLPVNMKGSKEQQLLLNNLSSTMQRICKSLRTVSDADLHGIDTSKDKLYDVETRKTQAISLSRRSSEQSLISGNVSTIDPMTQNISESAPRVIEADGPRGQTMTGSRKQTEKKRSTAEKHVSLSVLQQYFSGSLKDAAKSIGVCPTTLKRICRQHGISRWPSRKINKVNRSLRKIQIVLDSVQGVEGALKFDPTTGGLVASGSIIQELDSGKRFAFSNKDQSIENPNNPVVIHNSKSTSYMDFETTTVKMEEECLLDGNQVVGECQNNVIWPTSPNFPAVPSKSHFIHQNSSSIIEAGNELDVKDDAEMDRGDGIVEHNQPTSSGMTDSSNSSGSGSGSGFGSLMNDSSSSSRSFRRGHIRKNETSCGDSGSKIVVKATYNEDTVRFKFEPSAGYFQLYEEVAKRFKLQVGQFQLKYLDDEEEWVMLDSDSDLQECLEILDFVGTRNVKFLVRDVASGVGSSGGSNCFLGEGS
ncbi:hypothetical protein ABFS83_14G294100 [Erythranthe nasuta]